MSILLKAGPSHTKEAHHPWQKTIKDVHSSNLQTAHNTVNNPPYPKKKQKIPDQKKLTKFTIIGDRVNKDFIHSVNLVEDLHKYRRKIFDAPIIRGRIISLLLLRSTIFSTRLIKASTDL